LLGSSSSLMAELESARDDVVNSEGTSAASERRSTPAEGHMCRWAMASRVGLPSMLSPISSTFRDGHVLARAWMFVRDPRAGPFTKSGTPQYHSHLGLPGIAHRAGVNTSLSLCHSADKTLRFHPGFTFDPHLTARPRHFIPSLQHCTTIRPSHSCTNTHALFGTR
jgi:hypothetical protein